MFGMESFTQMPDPRDLAKIFDKNNPENTKWLSFRDSEDSRFVSLVMPHTLRRLPYGEDNPIEEFNYQETIDGEHDNYLWGNAAYDVRGSPHRLAFAKHHWCVAIRGPEGGGLVEDLPIHVVQVARGRRRVEVPDRGADSRTRGRRSFRISASSPLLQLQEHRLRGLLRCELGAAGRRSTTTAAATANAKLSSADCSTSWRPRGLPTT